MVDKLGIAAARCAGWSLVVVGEINLMLLSLRLQRRPARATIVGGYLSSRGTGVDRVSVVVVVKVTRTALFLGSCILFAFHNTTFEVHSPSLSQGENKLSSTGQMIELSPTSGVLG